MKWCERLAERGFAALALDFYRGRTAATPTEALMLRDAANQNSQSLATEVAQAYSELAREPRLRATKRFLLGWSFGAAWATFSSGFLPDVSGVVAYYGQAFTDDAQLYVRLKAPILLVGAERDTAPSPDKLRGVLEQLQAHGQAAEMVVVPANHGFAEAAHPGYDPEVAERVWSRVIDFLEQRAAAPRSGPG
jgi:carboxymethylenebutenolidase